MATLVPSRSARRVGLLVGGGNTGALTDADFRGCRWIEGEPRPLRRGMFCGRPVLAGESWCAMHRGIVFGDTPPTQEVGFRRRRKRRSPVMGDKERSLPASAAPTLTCESGRQPTEMHFCVGVFERAAQFS